MKLKLVVAVTSFLKKVRVGNFDGSSWAILEETKRRYRHPSDEYFLRRKYLDGINESLVIHSCHGILPVLENSNRPPGYMIYLYYRHHISET